MKILRLFMLCLLSISLTYCSDDETTPDQDTTDQTPGDNGDNGDSGDNGDDSSNQEGTVLNADIVADGLIIEGATKITDTAPQPNGGLTFTLGDTGSALVNEGFEIPFSSDSEVAGAYLLISSTDGNQAASYYDIPSDAFGRMNLGTQHNPFERDTIANKMEDEQEIEVNLNTNVPTGVFCYSLCVYDSNGNISQPQEVCITIESYGGNNDLVGDWGLVRYQETYDGVSIDAGPNEDFCYVENLDCNNGGTVAIEECSRFEMFTITFNTDGTYTLFERFIDNDIDFDQTVETCTEVERPEAFYEYTSEGNWAFNQTDNRLIMVEYSYAENDNGDIDSESFGLGDGEVVFDDPIIISGNQFILSIDYNDGTGDNLTLTFEK